jgi:hypothetical protein
MRLNSKRHFAGNRSTQPVGRWSKVAAVKFTEVMRVRTTQRGLSPSVDPPSCHNERKPIVLSAAFPTALNSADSVNSTSILLLQLYNNIHPPILTDEPSSIPSTYKIFRSYPQYPDRLRDYGPSVQ